MILVESCGMIWRRQYFVRAYKTSGNLSSFFFFGAMTWPQFVFGDSNWYLISTSLLSKDGLYPIQQRQACSSNQ